MNVNLLAGHDKHYVPQCLLGVEYVRIRGVGRDAKRTAPTDSCLSELCASIEQKSTTKQMRISSMRDTTRLDVGTVWIGSCGR